jgi:hypothetical protein
LKVLQQNCKHFTVTRFSGEPALSGIDLGNEVAESTGAIHDNSTASTTSVCAATAQQAGTSDDSVCFCAGAVSLFKPEGDDMVEAILYQ